MKKIAKKKTSKKKASKKKATKKKTSKKRANTHLRANALKQLKEKLISQRLTLVKDLKQMHEEIAGMTFQYVSGGLSDTHLLKHTDDNYALELTTGLIEAEEKQVKNIDKALERLEDGTFGICQHCFKPILLERMRALLTAVLCLPCKRREEEGLF